MSDGLSRPYSIVAALETGRRRGRQRRLGPEPVADVAAVTTVQIREPVERLVAAGQWKPGHPEVPVVLDAGYDAPRIAHLLNDLPVERYLEVDCRGTKLQFQVRTRENSIAIASNASFSGWTKTFTDPRLCAAIVDRLTFNSATIQTGTESSRPHQGPGRTSRNQLNTRPGAPGGVGSRLHTLDPRVRPVCLSDRVEEPPSLLIRQHR